MPTLIRYSRKSTLIFSHKEFLQFFRMPKWSTLHLFAEPHKVLWHFLRSFLVRYKINKLRKRKDLSIGVHWGFLVKKRINENFVNFHLADSHQDKFIDSEGQVLSGFQAACFAEYTPFSDKPFDMITVSHNSTRKKLDLLLEEFILIAEKDHAFTCCMVINTPHSRFRRNTRNTSVRFLERYMKLPMGIRNRIAICRLSDELGPLGVPKIFILKLMRESRIFVLASEKEGNAKVVAEAYSSGCFCIGSAKLEGDTFRNIPERSLCLLDGIKGNLSAWYLGSNLRGEGSQEFDMPPHASKFQETLKSLGLVAGNLGELDDLQWLDKKLPCLYPTSISHNVDNKETGTYDLTTVSDWLNFHV